MSEHDGGAERRAAREAALEAGRRERRQQEIDLLRKKAQEASERLRAEDANADVDVDADAAPGDSDPVLEDN